jgi:hypothetical protein
MSEPLGDRRKRLDNLLQNTVEEHNESAKKSGVGRSSSLERWLK